jgi:hypothetical protein
MKSFTMQQQQLVVPPHPNPTATATIASVESINQSINQSITILVGAWTWQMLAEACQSSQKKRCALLWCCFIFKLVQVQFETGIALRELQGL